MAKKNPNLFAIIRLVFIESFCELTDSCFEPSNERSYVNEATWDDETEAKEHPGQVHSLELGSKPEVDDSVLVELAPDVEDGHDHGVHQHRDLHEQGHDDGQEPVEDQHEEVISRPAVKYSCLQAETEHNSLKTFDEETNEWLIPVVVEEIEIDEEVESCLRGEGVVE